MGYEDWLKMLHRRISKVVLLLLLIVGVSAVAAQDVSKLVRITKGDNWVYTNETGSFEYNVSESIVNRANKEVNIVKSNATVPQLPFTTIVFPSYNKSVVSQRTSVDTIETDGFSITFNVTSFEEYFGARGNYWHGCSGTVNITIAFGDTVISTIKTGELWINAAASNGQNLAIVTGDPQIEILAFRHNVLGDNGNPSLEIFFELMFLLYPSDPYSTTWNSQPVTAIDITETIKRGEFYVNYVQNSTTYRFRSSSLFTVDNTYTYASEIGLPIIISRTSEMSQSETGLLSHSQIIRSIERLVSYSIKESVSLSGSQDFDIASLLPAIGIVGLGGTALGAFLILRRRNTTDR